MLNKELSVDSRLAALKSYEIVDTPAEKQFDDIVKLASEICNTPVSLISLVDDHRQWFKAKVGFDEKETSLDKSICVQTMWEDDTIEIPDLSQDNRFKNNPFVLGDPRIRFYSGVPLKTSEGFPLGTLCVIDTKPRYLNEHQRFALQTLANQVMSQLELRRSLLEQEHQRIDAEKLQRLYEAVTTNTPDFIYIIGLDKRFIYANHSLLTMWGKTSEETVGKNFFEIGYEPWHASMHEQEVDQVIKTKREIRGTIPFTGTHGRRIYDYIFAPVLDEQGDVTAIAGTTRDITEHEEAEEALRISEERRAFALEASDFVGIWDWNIKENLVIADERFAKLYSVDPSLAAKGAPIEEFLKAFHPDDAERITPIIEKIVQESGTFSEEYRLIQPDGSIRWVVAKGRVHQDDQHQPYRFAGVVIDITNRKIAEQKLAESEQQLKQLTDAIPTQVWTARPDGKTDYINRYTSEYVGEIPLKNGMVDWKNIVDPQDNQPMSELWKKSVATGKPYEVQQRIFHQESGRYRWNITRGNPIYSDNGSLIKWVGTNTDIDDQKQLTEKADSALAHLNLMVESALDYAILSLDANGLLVSWNTGAELIFGYKIDEVIGQHISLIFTPEDRQNGAAQNELLTAVRNGRANDERWHLRKNGERFFASGITASMQDNKGEVRGFIKIARDMTKERYAQEMLIEARNAAEAANIAKSEFLANMSHEIRTPMNAVIGLSNILSKSEPLTSKQQEFIKTLQMSADSLLALINDLLDISKIEARTVELENMPFNVTQMMQEVISMMSVRVHEKNLTFTGEGECVERQMYMGDPTRLRQIIVNLCSNAIKFTDKGNIHIKIECCPTEDESIENILISVQDTGIGIASDKLETIFHKFVQADSSINRRFGGTGLGLAITKTLTEIMGGTLSVQSQLGEGSTFTACIPLKKAEGFLVSEITGSFSEAFSNKNVKMPLEPVVLLVEDYAPNVMVAQAFLEEFGYLSEVAVNGIEAVEKSRNGKFVAILMDVQMHGMNGLEATKLIREFEKIENKQRVPIIGMTAHALSGDKERCLAAGMDDYISKPFNPNDLKEKLNSLTNSL